MNIFIFGAGTVGLSTGKVLHDKGEKVIFVDINNKVIEKLSSDGYEAVHPNDLEKYRADVSIITVPTPMLSDGSVNNEFLLGAIKRLGAWLRRVKPNKHLVVIRSTVLPYTTRNYVIPLLEKESGVKVGEDIKLCYHPEFLRANSGLEDSMYPWALVIGEYDKESGDLLLDLYNGTEANIYRVKPEMAEFVKYICNYFNALKISFANEIWLLGRILGIDSNKALDISSNIAEGFWNKSYGMLGGMPFGGTCLPKDTMGLYNLASSEKFNMPILRAVIQINSLMVQLSKIGIASESVSGGPNWKPSPTKNGYGVEF